MNLTILGSGDAFCSGNRFNTCLKLDAGGQSMLVDCGATSMLALNRAGVDRNSISTILFTHFHGDHFAGLPFFLLDGRFMTGRTQPLLIAGPKGIADRCRQIMDAMFPGFWDAPQVYPVATVEVTPDAPATLSGIAVTALPAVHDDRAGPCQSYRFAHGGKVFAFTGDTVWTEAMTELAAGSDVLLSECYTARTKLPNHLDWQTLDRRRADLKTRRMIVTHMGPEMLAFDGAMVAERAFDGMAVPI